MNEIMQRECDNITALASRLTESGYNMLALHVLNTKLKIQRGIRKEQLAAMAKKGEL